MCDTAGKLLSIVVLCLGCGLAGQQDPNAAAAPAPFVSLPRMPAPTLDGVVDDEEWRAAAATTGMKELDGPLAARQTLFYAGYDEASLYVAFASRQETLALGMGGTGNDVLLTNDAEGVEVWLQPPGRPAMQFLGVPAGGSLTDSADRSLHGWGKTVRFASRVSEGTEMAGRIMTMSYKMWYGEVAIPFADLGVACPQDGEVWRVNFCRDFTTKDQSARAPADWTTWAPITNLFSNAAEFGYARFDAQARPFRLLGLGDLSAGSLALSAAGPAGTEIHARVALAASLERAVSERRERVPEQGTLDLTEAIRIAGQGLTGMALRVAARDPAGRLLAQDHLRFTLLPAFWIRADLLPTARRVNVTADASRSVVPEGARVEVALLAPGGTGSPLSTVTGPIAAAQPVITLATGVAAVSPGTYTLRASLRAADGSELATAEAPVTVPETPVWLGNRLGCEEAVPPPFTPVKVDGRKVSVVLRDYVLADSGLPAAIVAKGMPLLTGPVELRAVANGKPVRWRFSRLRLTSHSDGAATYAIGGTSKALDIAGTLGVEFDGFANWGVTLSPKGPVTLDSLQLVAPIRAEHALFARGDGFLTASLLQDGYSTVPGREDLVTLGNAKTEWGSWTYSRRGWVWPETFCNEVYAGDDQVGFSLMTEGARNLVGPKYADFVNSPSGKTVEMVIHLVSRPLEMKAPLDYRFLYQTMPMRPEPKDPKRWHVGYDPSTVFSAFNPAYQTAEAKAFLSHLAVGQVYYDLVPDGYPRLGDEARAREGLRYFQDLGMQITHNLWWAAIADSLPEHTLYGAEWEAIPKYGWGTPHGHLSSACQNSSFHDFSIWCTKGILDLGFDGFYTDATPVQCSNALHGCGCVGPDGTRQPTLNLLATRAFAKRMYALLKADGKDRINFNHSGEGGAIGAFADVRTHGEEICWEGKDHYRRIAPDFFRARYAQNENGSVYTFLPILYFSWRKVGEATPLSEALMMSLAHRVGLTIAWSPEIVKVWEVFDPWWTTSDFIPYWKGLAPVVSSVPLEVTVSTFLKRAEKQALAEVSNWTYEAASVDLRLDPAKLGFRPTRLEQIDIPTGAVTPLDLQHPTLEVKARNFQAVRVR